MSKWTDDVTNKLIDLVGNEKPVSVETVDKVADELGFTPNSVAAKLRKMGAEVASRAKAATKTFSESEAIELAEFVQKNSGKLTYAEIAANFAKGKFTTKQIQGRILFMELTDHVKATEKVEVERKYTAEEEQRLLDALQSGKEVYVEDLSEMLGKSISSIRGKILSFLREYPDLVMPKQKQSYAKTSSDGLDDLGPEVEHMTVEEIAEALDKSPRGVKVMLTHRGIDCANYKGKTKREKLDAKKDKAA